MSQTFHDSSKSCPKSRLAVVLAPFDQIRQGRRVCWWVVNLSFQVVYRSCLTSHAILASARRNTVCGVHHLQCERRHCRSQQRMPANYISTAISLDRTYEDRNSHLRVIVIVRISNYRDIRFSRFHNAYKCLYCDDMFCIPTSWGFPSPNFVLFVKLCMVICITTDHRRIVRAPLDSDIWGIA